MGIMIVKIKIMPSSPDVDLEEIKTKVKGILEENKTENIKFEEEPVAFGLKAILTDFQMDEKDELEPIENSIRELETVSSAEIAEMKRAFG
jgi:elongation factor 1-beta